jgi:ribosome biogenesis GTPase A
MVPIPFIEQADKKGYWINELESLGISPKEIVKDYENESDCITELAGHVENIKQAFYQEYKTSYSERMIQLEGEEEKNAIVV